MLNGDIGSFPLKDVLAFLAGRKASGRLAIAAGDRWGAFLFNRGMIDAVQLEGATFAAGDECVNAALELLSVESGEFSMTAMPARDVEGDMEVGDLLDLVERRHLDWRNASLQLG